MPDQFVSIFVPLILVIVIEVSSVLREMELTSERIQSHIDKWNILPIKWVALHVFNYSLLVLALGSLQTSSTTGNLQTTSTLIISFSLFVLPFLETRLFDGGIPLYDASMVLHFGGSLLLIFYFTNLDTVWILLTTVLLHFGYGAESAATNSTISIFALPILLSLIFSMVLYPILLAKTCKSTNNSVGRGVPE